MTHTLHPSTTRHRSPYRSPYQAAVVPLAWMPRPQRPNYLLRRVVVLGVVLPTLIVATVMLLVVLLAGPGGRPASASRAEPAHSGVAHSGIVVAELGDSLWSIAVEHRGPVGLEAYLDALIDLNGSANIQAGQAVRLP